MSLSFVIMYSGGVGTSTGTLATYKLDTKSFFLETDFHSCPRNSYLYASVPFYILREKEWKRERTVLVWPEYLRTCSTLPPCIIVIATGRCGGQDQNCSIYYLVYIPYKYTSNRFMDCMPKKLWNIFTTLSFHSYFLFSLSLLSLLIIQKSGDFHFSLPFSRSFQQFHPTGRANVVMGWWRILWNRMLVLWFWRKRWKNEWTSCRNQMEKWTSKHFIISDDKTMPVPKISPALHLCGRENKWKLHFHSDFFWFLLSPSSRFFACWSGSGVTFS